MHFCPLGHNIFRAKEQFTVNCAHSYTSAYIYSSYLVSENMSETESVYDQDYESDSTPEVNVLNVSWRYHKGGKSGQHVREEPNSWLNCKLAHLQ